MSIIEVLNISKVYKTQKALTDISFTIDKPGVIGLLGPNGAGKSTLMKILCGYIPPTSGKAYVCGFDIRKDSMQVKKRVGYLTEHNSLYEDMYVKEYLQFVGELYGMDGIAARIKEVLEKVKFGSEISKKIGSLSKGYRQRVGLAQALLPNPEVLILDEPTTGLDPNQIEEIRELLREMGKEKTLILSTHIMQEAQAICSRIIMLNKGQMIADASTDELLQKKGECLLQIEFKEKLSSTQKESLLQMPYITRIEEQLSVYRIFLSVSEDVSHCNLEQISKTDQRAGIFKWAVENGLTVLAMQAQEDSLESVFHKLTSQSQ